jgi:hypothetical protein
MECVVCYRKGGSDDEGVITLQSTAHGMVCPRCIGQLVGEVIKMRTPWTEEDLKEWGYDMEKLKAHMRGYIQRGEEE